jgi:ribosomal protein S6
MPLYEIFCLARPAMQRQELFKMIKRSCETVVAANGVITKITYNGVTILAYTIKNTHGHFSEVSAYHPIMLELRPACVHVGSCHAAACLC